ncbi:uncharacterized protein LOC133385750 [Rhineura floridana]|uniref:uncharacterized protein LOC133385750 n=1 Tax=Rhineura floridana TaxID=261503 RepID=UPI002AC8107E|nr:uncharacterized protein LOC133385750 [Rhineura floridana]
MTASHSSSPSKQQQQQPHCTTLAQEPQRAAVTEPFYPMQLVAGTCFLIMRKEAFVSILVARASNPKKPHTRVQVYRSIAGALPRQEPPGREEKLEKGRSAVSISSPIPPAVARPSGAPAARIQNAEPGGGGGNFWTRRGPAATGGGTGGQEGRLAGRRARGNAAKETAHCPARPGGSAAGPALPAQRPFGYLARPAAFSRNRGCLPRCRRSPPPNKSGCCQGPLLPRPSSDIARAAAPRLAPCPVPRGASSEPPLPPAAAPAAAAPASCCRVRAAAAAAAAPRRPPSLPAPPPWSPLPARRVPRGARRLRVLGGEEGSGSPPSSQRRACCQQPGWASGQEAGRSRDGGGAVADAAAAAAARSLARCKGPRRNSRAQAKRRQRAHQVLFGAGGKR